MEQTEHIEQHQAHHADEHHHAAQHSAMPHHKPRKTHLQPLLLFVVVILAYLLIALALFPFLTFNMATRAPGSGGDTYQNLWSIWWVKYALLNLHTSIYHTQLLFWPVGVNLAYQTFAPIGSLISIPFQAVSIPFAYNVLFFIGYALSGFFMFLLARHLTKNNYAAFLSGLFFTFSAFHIAQAYSHIDWMFIGGAPLFVYFLLRLLEERSYFNAIGFGVAAVLATFMGDPEQLIMLFLLFIVLIAYFLINKQYRRLLISKRTAIYLLIGVVVAAVLGSWGFVPLIKAVSTSAGLSTATNLNDQAHNLQWSDNIMGFFSPSYYDGLFISIVASHPAIYSPAPVERTAYIGFVVIALGAYAVYRRRDVAVLWLAVAFIFAWLAVGPYPQIGSFVVKIPTLYSLYHSIPALNVIREPGRFDLIVEMALALLAGYGAKELLDRFDSKMYYIVGAVALITVLFLIESNGIPANGLLGAVVSNAQIPQFYYQLGALKANFTVLELPAIANPYSASPNLYTGLATYHTTATHLPVVGGYAGTRENSTADLSLYNVPLAVQVYNLQTQNVSYYYSPVVQNYTQQTLLTLYNYNTGFVVVQKSAFNKQIGSELVQYLYNLFGAPVYNDNTILAFETVNAVNNNLYKTFVAYPLLTQWESIGTPVNGTVQNFWAPLGQGRVSVFAPVTDRSQLNTVLGSPTASLINATISFDALAYPNSSVLDVYLQNTKTNGILKLVSINVTRKPLNYVIHTQMTIGQFANNVYFITASNASQVVIRNITFS